jgi:glutamine---fructose-6-phosphate transaminase (isomerizing)
MDLTLNNATYREILNQPQAWAATLRIVAESSAAMAHFGQLGRNGRTMLTGCGSPHYLAQSVASALQSQASVQAQAQPASNLWLFPQAYLAPDNAVLVCISRSGETTEVQQAVGAFRAATNGQVLLITCYEDTSLARLADAAIVLDAAQEQSLAQTQSFTSMLIAAQAFVQHVSGYGLEHLQALPDDCRTLLDAHHDLARQLGENTHYERFFFLGSGPLYGIACEAMLKLKEMALTYSEAYHFLEFRHGPMAMVDDKTLVVGLVSSTATAHEQAVLREMRGLGADVLALTPSTLPADAYTHEILLPGDHPDDNNRLALYLPILQLMAQYRAVARGLNPDSPENLNAFVSLDLNEPERET